MNKKALLGSKTAKDGFKNEDFVVESFNNWQTNEVAKKWLKPMDFVMNHFGNGEIKITPRGSFKIGNITMQRKRGDAGRKSAQMLQFKINPAELITAL